MRINAAPLPICEDDETIVRMVEDAEIPALLVALAHITGNRSLIRAEWRPPLNISPTGAEPQGGLSPKIQKAARAAAVEAIRRYRDAGCPKPQDLSKEELHDLIKFITGDAANDYLSLVVHELGLSDPGAPKWRKEAISPDRELNVAIIGAGMSGIVMAHRLRQAGVSVVVFEKNPEVGGTWWENQYPGCRLDTSNFAYSFSFAQRDDWPNLYSPQADILDYLVASADMCELRPHIRFETEVVRAAYDESCHQWSLDTVSSDGTRARLEFQAVILAVGQLSRPTLPDIPGRDEFSGPAFHSARWRKDVDLQGRKVAVIGTGASAFQIIPSIASQVAELSIYQRTPAWMLPAPHYHKPLSEGLAWLFRHLPLYSRWFRFYQFWTSSENRLKFFKIDENWQKTDSVSAANEELRQVLYNNMAPQYRDRPELLEKVIPTYPPGAKRMLRDNGVWAETLKRDNVELITSGIERITPHSICGGDGKERETDVIIYATGFSASDFYAPIEIVGKGGVDLKEYWGGDARAYLAGCVPGFPNLFSIFGPNAALVVNGSIFFISECTSHYIVECLRMLLTTGSKTMEVTTEALDEFTTKVDRENESLAWGGISRVNSWYRNDFGRSSQVWPFTLGEYWNQTREPVPSHFDLTYATPRPRRCPKKSLSESQQLQTARVPDAPGA